MAWNEPGNGQRDPWNKNKRGSGGKPGIETAFKDVLKRLGKLGGPGGILTIIVAILLAWLLLTSYAVIGAGQVGVVQRFGAYTRTIGPGFHVKLPLPIETVQPVATARIRAMSDQIRMLTPRRGHRRGGLQRAVSGHRSAEVPVQHTRSRRHPQ